MLTLDAGQAGLLAFGAAWLAMALAVWAIGVVMELHGAIWPVRRCKGLVTRSGRCVKGGRK